MRARWRATCRSSAALVEFGTGSTKKARILIEAAPQLAAYVPVDISAEFLAQEAAAVRRDIPWIAVLPVAADFTRDFDLPAQIRARPRVGFFPGSTIGNFEPEDAAEFLRQAGRILGPGATMIVGVDRIKDKAVLDAAYDDAAGVTARFNLNVLARMNRELGGDFDLSSFRHRAFYNADDHRIEMHLESLNGADRHGRGPHVHVRQGRDDPHREFLQVHGGVLPRARRERRLAAGRDLDRRARLFRGACAEAVSPLRATHSALILRSARSARLEGWPAHALAPSFETPASRGSSG